MKKKLMIGLISLIIIVAALLGYAAANLNGLIAKFKPEIERTASQLLKTGVTLGELEASVFPEARIHVKELKLASNSSSKGFALKDLFLAVKILPLLSRKLEVSKLTITDPSVTIVKGATGFSIAGLPPFTPDRAKATGTSAPKAADGQSATDSSKPPAIALNLERFEVAGASVQLASEKGGQPVNLTRVDLEGSVSLEIGALQVTDIELNGEVLSSGKLEFTGQLSNLGTKAPRVELSGTLASLDFKAFHPLFTLLEIPAPPHQGSADLAVALSGDLLSPQIKGKLDLNVNSQPVAINFDTALSAQELNAKLIQIAGFAGTIDNKAQLTLASKQFSFDSSAKGIQVEPLIRVALPTAPAILNGQVKDFTLKTTGALSPQLMQSIKGAATINFVDGSLKGVNLAGQVLQAISGLPFLSGSLHSKVPEQQRAAVDSKDTLLKSVTGSFKIEDNGMNTEDLLIDGGIFTLSAKGRVGFDTALNLGATIKFSPEFSRGLAQAFKEIEAIYDENKQLAIPLKITGQVSAPEVLPNVQDLLKRAGSSALKNRAGELLNKALGGSKGKGGGLGGLLGL